MWPLFITCWRCLIIETKSYVPQTIKTDEYGGIKRIISYFSPIPLKPLTGLSGYKLRAIRIESYHRFYGSADYYIKCELAIPKKVVTSYFTGHPLPITCIIRQNRSGREQFFHLNCAIELPEREQTILRSTLPNILNCLAGSIADRKTM